MESDMEPCAGLELMTLKSELKLRSRVGHLTNKATQASLGWAVLTQFFNLQIKKVGCLSNQMLNQ